MVFSALTFLYGFLPIVIVLYFLVPKEAKNLVLFASSLFFYAWGEKKLVFMLLTALIIGYGLGLAIEKHRHRPLGKYLMIALVVINLIFLGYYKYTDFFIESFNAATGGSIPLLHIALPIGISFYTFQILSYGVDIYRGDICAEKNFINLGCYITFFAQLIAGPIVRYSDIKSQLTSRFTTLSDCAYGIRRFAIGLGKKVLIANTMGSVTVLFRTGDADDLLFHWIYALAFMLQIYFDFSGYSDMAIGMGRIFGFKFKENFNYPYIARSITDFWSRWHISLGTWFRDYVYIPLGGNRCSIPRQIFNILVVWMLTGLWHGAAVNFILWGLLYALLLGLEKFLFKDLLKSKPWIGHMSVIFFVMLGFVLFNAESPAMAVSDVCGMFNPKAPLTSVASLYYLRSYGLSLIIGIIGATPLPVFVIRKICHSSNVAKQALGLLEPIFIFALLLVSTAFIVAGSFNPFLYFRF